MSKQILDGEVRLAWFRLSRWVPKPLHGCGVTLGLKDGTEVMGHYMIVENGAVTPCVNPFGGWLPSKGFPKDDQGNPVWGNELREDSAQRGMITTIGNSYTQDDPDVPTIVSFEGVVMTGNMFVMAGMRAARFGTDSLYIEWLRNHCAQLGFSPDDVAEFPHPRLMVVLRRGEVLQYSRNDFQRFDGAEVIFKKLG